MRPYPFIEFNKDIQNSQKKYIDNRTLITFTQINSNLNGIQRVMVKNIDDLIQRGEFLSALDNKLKDSSFSKVLFPKHGDTASCPPGKYSLFQKKQRTFIERTIILSFVFQSLFIIDSNVMKISVQIRNSNLPVFL